MGTSQLQYWYRLSVSALFVCRYLRLACGVFYEAEIPYSTYLKIEHGTTPNPSIQAVLNIAEALEVAIDSFDGRI